jgi:hypothetical protein
VHLLPLLLLITSSKMDLLLEDLLEEEMLVPPAGSLVVAQRQINLPAIKLLLILVALCEKPPLL